MYFKNNRDIDNEFNNKNNIISNILNFLFKYKIIIGIVILLLIIIIIIFSYGGKNINNLFMNEEYYLILDGDDVITIYQDSDYIEPGYRAYSSNNYNLNGEVKVTSNINTSVVGEYEITYKIDNIVKKRKIVVIEKPMIYTFIKLNTIDNKTDIYLNLGEKYIEPGYNVFSTTGMDLNDRVVVNGNVDTLKKGKYQLIYSLVDDNGITISVSRLVIVMDTEIDLSLNNNEYTNKDVGINILVDDDYFDYMLLPDGSKISDNSYLYIVSSNGVYTFKTYNTKGVVKEKSIEVKNIDKVLPSGSCSGSYENGKSFINVNATDNIGIKKYVIEGQDYTNDKITLNKEFKNVLVKIYDNVENVKEIRCSLKDNNKPIISDKSITFSYKYVTGNDYMSYGLFTPSTVSEGKKIPLVVWLHGGGTFGVGENSFYTNNFIKMIREWKLDGFNAYILCPHSTGKWRGSGYWINDTVINNVFSLIDKFIKDNKVDTDKIVLVGYSQGARGALYIPTKRMNFFSALVVLSAFDVPVDISVLKDVPTKGYSEGFTYMNTTFVNVFGKENYKKISVSHVELPKAVFTLDENNDNKSDVVEWMLNQKLKK